MRPCSEQPAARPGTTLVELLAALAVTAILAAATFRLLDHTQRLATAAALLADQRAQLAGAITALRFSIEDVATSGNDLLATSDSSVSYAGTVGVGVACTVTATSADFAAALLADGSRLTHWNQSPRAGDHLVIFDEGPSPNASDDSWFRTTLTTVSALPGACLTTPLADSIADAGSVGWRLGATTPLPPTVPPGAPARILRPERFALYNSAGEWMLGVAEWNTATSAWNAIQPLAGPLLPFSPTPPSSGLSLRWTDPSGAPSGAAATPPPSAAHLTLRAPTRAPLRAPGHLAGPHPDSVSARIPMRNAR